MVLTALGIMAALYATVDAGGGSSSPVGPCGLIAGWALFRL